MSDLNICVFTGRLTAEPDARKTNDGRLVARFSLAVNRKVKDKADFPSLVAFDKGAELVQAYLHKGDRVGARCRVVTGNYTDRDGKKVYTTDFVVDEITFLSQKQQQTPQQTAHEAQVPYAQPAPQPGYYQPAPQYAPPVQAYQPAQASGAYDEPGITDDDLPF